MTYLRHGVENLVFLGTCLGSCRRMLLVNIAVLAGGGCAFVATDHPAMRYYPSEE